MIMIVTRLGWLQSVRTLKAWQGDEVGSDGTIWSRNPLEQSDAVGGLFCHGAGRQRGKDDHLGRLSREAAWVQEGPAWRQLGKTPAPHFPQGAAAPMDALPWPGKLTTAALLRMCWGVSRGSCRGGQKCRQVTAWACALVLCNEVEWTSKSYMWFLRVTV